MKIRGNKELLIQYLKKGYFKVAINGNLELFITYPVILKAITKPPIENPIIKYDQKLTSCKYSGAKNKYGIPYLVNKTSPIIPNKTIQNNKIMWFLLRLIKKSCDGKKKRIFLIMKTIIA